MATDRLQTMLNSGDLHEMLQQPQPMMETMQVNSSPTMLALMKANQIWQMLKSGADAQVGRVDIAHGGASAEHRPHAGHADQWALSLNRHGSSVAGRRRRDAGA